MKSKKVRLVFVKHEPPQPKVEWTTAYVKKEFGSFGGPDTAKKASAKVDEFNKKHNKELAKFKQLPNGETVVAICDPLNRRVHELVPQAGDIVFVDGTSNVDLSDSKLFTFLTVTPAHYTAIGK